MGNYENLKQSITEVIRTNGNKEITGAVLQSTLLTIISTVGANATFAGIATPTTNPGTPDGPVFYLASEAGTYTNFNAVELQAGLSVLMWNGSWSSQQIFSADDVPTAESDNLVKSGGVYAKIKALEDAGITNMLDISVLGYPIYLENTLVDARNGSTSTKGTTPDWDCIIIPTRGAKRAYIEGLNINIPGYVCFWEDMPLFKNSSTGGFISNITTNVINESFVFDIPDNAKVLGFSLASSLRLTEETRAKIRIRDSYIDEKTKPLSDEIEEVENEIEEVKRDISVLGYPIYLENTTVDARNGSTTTKGTTPDWDCVIIPTKGAKKAYIEGIDIKVPDYVCFWENMPLFKNSSTGGFISNIATKVVNEGFVFDIPDNAKVFGFSLSSSLRLTEEEREKIRIRDYYVEEEVTKKTVSINSNLGFVANFDLSKYDDLLLIMDGQSLSIGWESIAISVEPYKNCYMLGTDPCTLYNSGNNSNGYNGIGLKPLKAVTRESPNVSWTNVLSKLIPNKRLITESVGEGSRKISQLSKTENTEIYTAEFLGHGVICDPSNGGITIGESSWKTWLLQVEEGQTYYIAGGTQAVTEFSQRPNIGTNPNIYIGNGNVHITNKEYLCPQGVTYIAMTINNSEYVGEKMFVIKGEANRYERGFLLPLYQTANISDISQKKMGCPAIAWMQGESDADGGTTKEEYKEMLVNLKNDMVNDIKEALSQEENVLFLCYIPAMAYNKDNQIAQAIIECCEENDDMILIAPVYPMPDYNNLHMSSNGNRWFGEYIARTTYNSIVLGKRNNSMIVNQITKKGNEIKISIDVPQLPIVRDTWIVQEVPDLGFTIWKDNVKCTISNIDIFSNVITITTIENVDNGVIEVSYAGKNTDNVSLYRGTGNIRDSDRWQAMQYYLDDTNDKGTDGTSTITYRPKTKDGKTIINKKYPMQNWLQNFYFKFE